MTDDNLYWLGFSAFPGIGPMRFKALLNYFGSAKDAWNASYKDLLAINLGEKLAQKFVGFRDSFSLHKFLSELKAKDIKFVTLNGGHYPKLLKEISDAPFVLYIKGKKTGEWNIARSIGIVGTRKITEYGRLVTERITEDMVSYGFTIVSGMAYGVDAVAHETAMDSGGKTIAVLGCGVDLVRPQVNYKIYQKIVGGAGAVVAEFPPGMESSKGLFPARNRIISGLSLGIVVTEGAKDSGALITAGYAAEQGREVFAVPGPITSQFSKGPTKLLKSGAKMVTEVGDILEELNIKYKNENIKNTNKKLKMDLTKDEEMIVQLLESESLHFDELVRNCRINPTKLGGILSMMEIKGIIKNANGEYRILEA